VCENHRHLGHRSDFKPLTKRFLSQKGKTREKHHPKNRHFPTTFSPKTTHRKKLVADSLATLFLLGYALGNKKMRRFNLCPFRFLVLMV
jgi:hypothetical protein